MISKYIDVDGCWGIILFYDFNMLDWNKMADVMYAFGMDELDTKEAIRILSTPNSGMAVSNDGFRMTAIFIGDATSNSQFWSSVAHELQHCQDAILDYYGEELGGEVSAYTMGYLMQRVVEEIAEPCY